MHTKMSSINRRKFLRNAGLITAGISATPSILAGGRLKSFSGSVSAPFSGIQIGAHSILDEGIDFCLDLLKEKAAINTLVLYSHTYYGAENRPVSVFQDHGKGVRDISTRKLPRVWVKHHDEYFKDLSIKHQQIDDTFEYHDRDIFRELRKPLDNRGMKLYIRLLEASAHHGKKYIPNYDVLLTKDVYGNPGSGPCWNHPDYRQWMLMTVKDIFDHYEIDGIQYGAERVGPLSELLYKGKVPECFCEYCIKRNREKGIDPGRAKKGYIELHQLIRQVAAGIRPVDGVMTTVLGIMQKYHEVLGWNYQWFQADEEIQKMLYQNIKDWKPEARVGRHIDHQRSSWDMFYRSAVPYSEMAEYADFIKPILYHDIYGPRLRNWVINQWQKHLFNDMDEKLILDYYYAVFGYNPAKEPALDELNNKGLSPDYVYREVKRCVEGVNGKADVISGVGFDVPWHHPDGMIPFPSDPEGIYKAVIRSFEAGATGVLASRDYDEMKVESLEAFGRAVREVVRSASSLE